MQLNEEQLKVVNANKGVYQVQAGAGSGKTACLVARAVRLLEEGKSYNDMLTLTFTAEAARNLKDRVEREVDIPYTINISGFMTFHSFALAFVTREHENFPFHVADNPLATEGQCAKIGYELANKHDVNYKSLRSYISFQKRIRVEPDEALKIAEQDNENQSYALAYKQYDKRLRESGILDFDSLILETVKLLESSRDIRAKYQYKWIQCDEAQDTDNVQLDLIKLLSEQYNNVLYVGDSNQSIYSWRGANPQIFQCMKGNKLYLGKNYRSTKSIVNYVKKIAPIKNELLEHFTTDNEEGIEPEIFMYSTNVREASEVVKRVKNSEGSTAILGRTNLSLRAVEDELIEQNVKYYLLGDSGFWNRPEVKNVIAYVQCCAGLTDHAVLSALRAPFHPSKYIKKKQVADQLVANSSYQTYWQQLTADSNKSIQEFTKFLRSLMTYRYLPAKETISYILRDLKALEYYHEEEAIESDNNPVDNLKELVRVATRFGDVKAFLDFIRKVQNASKNKKGVALSTIHQFKGKEAHNVHLIQCCEGILPHKRSTNIDEEKNLFYVACSRPMKRLYISYVGEPSRFLELKEKKCQ